MISQLSTVESISCLPPKRSGRLADAARARLEQNAYFRGRSSIIQIDEHDGTLVLHGRLPSYYLKQVLQTELGGLDGVKHVDNRVEVFWPTPTPNGEQ